LTTEACTFPNAFFTGTTPIVVVTPVDGNPGSNFWVSAQSETGFTVNLAAAPSGNVTFNYIVVGVEPVIVSSSSVRASIERHGGFQFRGR
jgi:hypothetical protein